MTSKRSAKVGHGFDGLRSVLNIYGAVFAGACTAALAGGWFMFSKVGRVEDGIARIDVRLTQFDDSFKSLNTRLTSIEAFLNTVASITKRSSSSASPQTDGIETGALPQ